jgi:hypothetical protein
MSKVNGGSINPLDELAECARYLVKDLFPGKGGRLLFLLAPFLPLKREERGGEAEGKEEGRELVQ